MSLAAKFWLGIFALPLCAIAYARDLHILVIGESVSSNCNEYRYRSSNGVFQVDLSGNIIPASDPFLWADCQNGSTWIPLGRRIISENFAEKVTFMPISMVRTPVNDWLPNGKAFLKLRKAIKVANEKSIRFDYAFWHQGSSDARTPPDEYERKLSQVLKYISVNANVDKWIIAKHSKCGGVFNDKIAKAQTQVGSAHILKRYPGPNTDILDSELRYDNCHLNFRGQEKMADLWLQSMISADNLNNAVRKETLIHYFQGLIK